MTHPRVRQITRSLMPEAPERQTHSIAPPFRRSYDAIVRYILQRGVSNCDFTAIGAKIGGGQLKQLVLAGIVKRVGKNPHHQVIYRLVDNIPKETVEYYNRY